MGGAQPLAAVMAGACCLAVECDSERIDFRLRTRYVNERAGSELIPESIIQRPPSAELRDEQRDDQSLPPYDQLDPLIEAYVEDDLSPEEIARRGIATLEVARRVARLVDLAEYKRRQAPPGIKVHVKAFGRDRRLPITNRFGRAGRHVSASIKWEGRARQSTRFRGRPSRPPGSGTIVAAILVAAA
jgi:hypothetical protein